jgi:hypothetical protein
MSALLAALGKHIDSDEVRLLLRNLLHLTADDDEVSFDEDEPVERYLSSPAEGICIGHTEEGQVTLIVLFNEGVHAFSRYQGELPLNLALDSSPDDVCTLLGHPTFHKPASASPFVHGDVFRYERAVYAVNLCFAAAGRSIDSVSLIWRAEGLGSATSL